MSDPQEVATPSDPHSAEARAKYPDDYNGWSPQGIVIPSLREGFDAGRVSRDAEVAELKAKIAAVLALHSPGVVMPSVSQPDNQCVECSDPDSAFPVPWPCPTVLALGSASSPVEGRPHDN